MALKSTKIFVYTQYLVHCPGCSWSQKVAAWVNSGEKVVCERCLAEFIVRLEKGKE